MADRSRLADRSRAVFLGSGAFALPALSVVADDRATELVAVVTAPPRPAGRGGELRPTPVNEAAIRLGVDILAPSSLRDDEVIAWLLERAPGLIVLADYGRIVPPGILELPPHGALNLHPSLLPRHRGATPVQATILAGDAVTGVTLMRMDAGLDSGPIIAQREMRLDGTETTASLETTLARMAATLLADHLSAWLEGSIAARPQPAEGATLTRPLRRGDGRLEHALGAPALERQVRAYQPWPGSFLDDDGRRLVVWAAAAVPAEPGDEPGAVVADGDTLALATGEGRLRLLEVQPAGGRRMSGAEYLRGRRPRP